MEAAAEAGPGLFPAGVELAVLPLVLSDFPLSVFKILYS